VKTRISPRAIIKALSVIAVVGISLTLTPRPGRASSHREAPLVSGMPRVDGTDFYMFRSYESGRDGFVTIVANYVPLQDPFGGPNYFELDPDAIYEVHIDNVGDAQPHITFQFKFTNTLQDLAVPVGGTNIEVPLINIGPITIGDSSNLNVVETYTAGVIVGNKKNAKPSAISNASDNSTVFTKPVDNIGNKSLPDYVAYANQYVYNVNIPGCSTSGAKIFVGQRKDPFVVNLGETFDLVNIKNPIGEAHAADEPDSLAGKNITSIILEVPTPCLVTSSSQPIIGGWTTASLPSNRRLNPQKSHGKSNDSQTASGPYTEVSRLGMPLVNELVIGLPDKDNWNRSVPADDAQFLQYVTNPSVPALIEALFSGAGVAAPTLFPRTDLVATFLTGISGVNQPPNVVPSEELRLNTSTAITVAGSQNRLGVIGGDAAGYPNGRRPGDDVVDITLRVAMGRLITLGLFGTPSQAPSGALDFTDGAFVDHTFFDTSFPYIKPPLPGSPNGVAD
jgi:hypothetical protein